MLAETTAVPHLLLAFIERSKWGWLEHLARLAGAIPADAPLHEVLAASLGKWARQASYWFDRPSARQVQYLSTPACRSVLERLAGESGPARCPLSIELDRLAAPARG